METNLLPNYDDSVNLTGCCARFNPEGWDNQALHFKDKPFVRATTTSLAHIPLNMGKVFARVQNHIGKAGAQDPHQYLVLSRDLSAFQTEHLFAVTKPVDGEEITWVSGVFLTKVFEGSYSETRHWFNDMQAMARAQGKTPKNVSFYYTTCPKCAKTYGKNYVVGCVGV